jgi:hypothetical protein
MKKKTLTIPEYNEKLKSLQEGDEPLDDYLDEESKNAIELKKKERKRVAKALLAAAAVLGGSDGLEYTMHGILEDVARAIQFVKRKHFAKAQSSLEIAMAAAEAMVEADTFQDAEFAEQAESEAGSGHPQWAR